MTQQFQVGDKVKVVDAALEYAEGPEIILVCNGKVSS